MFGYSLRGSASPARRTDGKAVAELDNVLRHHVGHMVSVDFFTVPTVQLRVLYVFVVLAHDRRRVLHFNVTKHPTAGPLRGRRSRSFRHFRTTVCLGLWMSQIA